MPRQSKRTSPPSKPARGSKSGGTKPGRAKSPDKAPTKPRTETPVISRRDERGVPYPGDWSNPLDGLTRGCF